jgi:hypothetical protein
MEADLTVVRATLCACEDGVVIRQEDGTRAHVLKLVAIDCPNLM